ncbi:MAG: helix-turn-helix transcriptional regulator [Austwickia sp.]|jgi:predicted transcriptional regulator|nr:MAG: helix-turn-helix transcriptional regulator [Austwickia sp.]
MGMSLEEMEMRRPPREAHVRQLQEEMMAQVRAYQLRELRELAALTQNDVAERIGKGQRQVSKIERGDIERTQVDTLRRYAEALGGTLHVEIQVGGRRMAIA